MKKQKREKPPKGTWKNILKTIFSCCPFSAAFYIIWVLACVAASFFTLITLERLVVEVTAIDAGTASLRTIAAAVGILTLCTAIRSEWAINRLFRNRLCYMLNRKFAPRIMEKYARLDFSCYEDETLRNVMHLSTDNPITLPVDAFFSAVNGTGAVLSNVSVFAYFLTVSGWLALAFALLVGAVAVLDVLSNREVIRARWEQSPDARRMEDIGTLMRDKNALFELKFGGAAYLREKFRALAKKDAKRIFGASLRGFRYNAASLVLLAAWAAATTFILADMFGSGQISAGVTVTVVTSFPMTLNTAWRIASRFKTCYTNHFAAGYLYRLMNFPERDIDGAPVSGQSYEVLFENVWFRYPGTDKDVLKGVTFRLEAGKAVSLVGENGSGKSTAVKLLLRLYRPTAGRILLNGKDIWEYAEAEYYRAVGAVFQDFARYELPLDENISLAHGADLSAVKETPFYRSVAQAAESETAFLGKRLEGGRDLSGGEWQKIAILRLLYRSPGLMVLDEPTASLDARAENEIYETFRRLTKDRTALFISHRMALSRIADEIVVLEDGVVAERGTHEQLIAKEGGRYAQLFEKQAEWYQEHA